MEDMEDLRLMTLPEVKAALSPLQSLLIALTMRDGRTLTFSHYTSQGLYARFMNEGKVYELHLKEVKE